MSVFFILYALLCVLLLFFVYSSIIQYFRKPFFYPAGPPWLPIVGNIFEFRRRLSRLKFHHLVWHEYASEYGPIVGLKLGRHYVVVVSEVEGINEVFTREEFDGRPDGFFFRFRTFGKRLGIVFSDGPFWKKQRKFSTQHLRNFGLGRREMGEQIAEEARVLVEEFRKKCGEAVDMHYAFDVSVLNVLWAMIAGKRFDINDEKLITLVKLIHDIFKLFDMSGGILNQLPLVRFIAPKACGYRPSLDILGKIYAFFEETIKEHRQTLDENHARDLIDEFLIKMNAKDDETFTDEQLYSLCLDLFMAGSETTSNTLAFAMLYMLKYPLVQEKVQKELDAVLEGQQFPTLADRVRLQYTEAVIMEIQRIANVPPMGIAHRAIKSTQLRGIVIPKDAIVLTSLYSIHMDQDFWKDPHNFRPERFLGESGKVIKTIGNDWYFAPFGYGKRRCLGESLAKANLFMFFASILKNFRLERVPGDGEPDLIGVDGITLSPKPFRAVLKARNP